MTPYNPRLALQRLVVLKDQNVMYDEMFKAGVNVICGENSVGKSTIANLINYSLGGEYSGWVEEAKSCTHVLAEVLINDASLTLRREISVTSQRPMSIFYGNMDQALSASSAKWKTFAFAKRNDAQSFSEVLFKALGIPNVKGELASRITMHQMLRLLTVDQRTPADKMFQIEVFDSGPIRDAVGALLCGVYDDRIYQIEFDLRDKRSEFEELKTQEKAFYSVVAGTDDIVDFADMPKRAVELKAQLAAEYSTLEQSRASLSTQTFDSVNAEKQERLRNIAAELHQASTAVRKLTTELEALEFEIEDSKQFIEAIDSNLKALETSTEIKKFLGTVSFEFCPACYAPVGESSDIECVLCKAPKTDANTETQKLRIQQELALQVLESAQLQKERIKRRTEILPIIRTTSSKVDSLRLEYNDMLSGLKTPNEEIQAKIYQRIGYLQREIEDLENRLTMANRFSRLQSEKSRLIGEIKGLEDELLKREEAKRTKEANATSEICAHLARFLRHDLPVEKIFQDNSQCSFSFADDKVYVDGRNNFSESSKIILKNSFHFSLHVSSVLNKDFRYPRFTLFDNIEDKGMVPERSHQFQRLIINESATFKTPHQVIFTTSMVAPELKNSTYQVGPYYTRDNKTLRLYRKL